MTVPQWIPDVKVHFPNAIEKIKKNYTSQNKVNKQNIDESNKKWINFSLTKEALLSFDNKKAAGPDEIKPVLFEYLPDNFIRHLVFIYKCVIKLRHTPLLWKDTKVIFIPKPGKKDMTRQSPLDQSRYQIIS